MLNPDVHTTEAGSAQLSRQLQLWAQLARAAGLNDDDMLELLRRILNHDERVLS